MPTRLQIASDDIFSLFDATPAVLTQGEIENILRENRAFWRLAQSTTVADFVQFLKEYGLLQEYRFDLPHRPTVRYTWGHVAPLQLVQSLRPSGYFSHFTAMQLHGLTDQIPKTIYLNSEQRLRSGGGELSQESIDRAFRAKCRVSSNTVIFRDQTICVLNGGNTGNLGVVEFKDENDALLNVTGIERTLIDITVRPVYSGGVYEVASAFAAARDRVSVNRIAAFLRKLGYTYPYHQAIGCYLERSGVYSKQQIDIIRQFDMEFDFYLTHRMKDMEYVPHWRLFVPKGF